MSSALLDIFYPPWSSWHIWLLRLFVPRPSTSYSSYSTCAHFDLVAEEEDKASGASFTFSNAYLSLYMVVVVGLIT